MHKTKENGRVPGQSRVVRRRSHSTIFLAFILIVSAGTINTKCPAAEKSHGEADRQFWVGLSVGPGGFRTHFAVAGNLFLAFQDENDQYSLRLNRVIGIGGTNSIMGAPSHISEYGVLYGRTFRFGESHASLSAGLGFTKEQTARFGFPVEAALYGGQLKWIGVTLKICANITPGPKPSRSYWSVCVGFLVGKLR